MSFSPYPMIIEICSFWILSGFSIPPSGWQYIQKCTKEMEVIKPLPLPVFILQSYIQNCLMDILFYTALFFFSSCYEEYLPFSSRDSQTDRSDRGFVRQRQLIGEIEILYYFKYIWGDYNEAVCRSCEYKHQTFKPSCAEELRNQ